MKRILIILSCIFLICMHCHNVSALSDDIVRHLKVEWIVQENGFIRVYETYTVEKNIQIYEKDFTIQIPKNKQISWEDVREDVYVPVTNVCVESDQKYRIKNSNDCYSIIFDSNDVDEEYKISYLVKVESMAHNDKNYMFYDMVGKRTDCYIASMSFTIRLPKNTNDNISIRIPNYAGKDDKGIVSYNIEDRVITGSYENMTSYATMQVLIEVDEDYFHGINYDVFNYITLGICFVILFISIIWFQRKGKQKTIEEIVDVQITKELSSMEVGYIHKGYSDARGVVSLFIQWAQKGYIQLEYISESKNIVFRKLMELPTTAKDYEKVIFNAMFSNKNDVRMKALLSIFAKEVKSSQKIMKKNFNRSKTNVSLLKKLGFGILCALPIVIVIGTQVFMRTFSVSEVMSIVGIYFVIMTVFVIYMLFISSKNMKYVMLISIAVFAILTIMVTNINYGMYLSWDIISMTVMMSMMLVYTVSNIKLRNDYADYLLDSVKGLRLYIQKVDVNQKHIEELLPYAYALDVEYELLEHLDTLDWLKDNGTSVKDILELLTRHIFNILMDNRYI